MFTPYFTPTQETIAELEKIGQVFGYFNAVTLPTNYKREWVSKVTAEAVHASTAIEGNTLTEKQVGEVLQGKIITAEEKDIWEVRNYMEGMQFVQNQGQEKNLAISEPFIQDIHKIVVKDTKKDIAGEYRTKQVYVGDCLPPKAEEVASLMKEFSSWLINPVPLHISPVFYAGIAHYQLVAIHPFEDGNGRTARLLATFLLVRNGSDMTKFFAPDSFYNRNRKAYYQAIGSTDRYRKDGQPDLTVWLSYYVHGLLIEAERAKSHIEELLEKSKGVTEKVWITDNQKKALKLTKEKETAKIADYIKVLKLSENGSYKLLVKLVSLGLLNQLGEKKGSYYTITEKGLEYLK